MRQVWIVTDIPPWEEGEAGIKVVASSEQQARELVEQMGETLEYPKIHGPIALFEGDDALPEPVITWSAGATRLHPYLEVISCEVTSWSHESPPQPELRSHPFWAHGFPTAEAALDALRELMADYYAKEQQ